MMKNLLILTIALLSLPAYAGVFENAYNAGGPVFLYLYSKDCGYCKRFETRYRGLVRSHSDYKFLKIDAETEYGHRLMSTFEGYYVPYIVLTDKKMKKSAVISPMCAMNDKCTEKAMADFKKG